MYVACMNCSSVLEVCALLSCVTHPCAFCGVCFCSAPVLFHRALRVLCICVGHMCYALGICICCVLCVIL